MNRPTHQPVAEGDRITAGGGQERSLTVDDWCERIELALFGKVGNTFRTDRIEALRTVVAEMLPALEGDRVRTLSEQEK